MTLKGYVLPIKINEDVTSKNHWRAASNGSSQSVSHAACVWFSIVLPSLQSIQTSFQWWGCGLPLNFNRQSKELPFTLVYALVPQEGDYLGIHPVSSLTPLAESCLMSSYSSWGLTSGFVVLSIVKLSCICKVLLITYFSTPTIWFLPFWSLWSWWDWATFPHSPPPPAHLIPHPKGQYSWSQTSWVWTVRVPLHADLF